MATNTDTAAEQAQPLGGRMIAMGAAMILYAAGQAALDGGLPIPVATLAPPALLGLVVLMILTGRLVPRRTYDDKVHEANEWRAESRVKDNQIAVKDEQLAVKDAQLAHLSEVGRTVDALVRAIQTEGNREVSQ